MKHPFDPTCGCHACLVTYAARLRNDAASTLAKVARLQEEAAEMIERAGRADDAVLAAPAPGPGSHHRCVACTASASACRSCDYAAPVKSKEKP